MKKLLFISLLLVSASTYSQIDWPNYATSFEAKEATPALGVAIPYNGHYDNFDKNVVGISHWNPSYKLGIDTVLDDQIPLFFVYDTASVYFLVPQVNEKNAHDVEFTVLLNNKTIITPWSPISQFTTVSIGDMRAGSGMTGNYHADLGQYLVAHLRKKQGQIISSRVIYFKKQVPEVKSLSTADNAQAFSTLVNNENHFSERTSDVGWHRQYTGNHSGPTDTLKLSYNENNLLVDISSLIYKKEAIEYTLYNYEKEIRKWGSNEFNNHYILLKNLDPGNYRILIRLRRQRNSTRELHFLISPAWYKTAAFEAVVLAFLISSVLFVIFALKYRHQKKAVVILNKKADQSAEELQNIHSLLNPHFTFNALNSIQGLVNKGNTAAANTYLSSFGELLRARIKESKTEHIPLTKELANLETYISLEQLRCSFTYNLSVNTNINLFTTSIPPFLLQPFVENAIKHGIVKMNGSGALNLTIQKNDNTLLITITDNGPGFTAAIVKEGYGLSLSKRRIELLNCHYAEDLITLQLESTGKATSILLSFKNWL